MIKNAMILPCDGNARFPSDNPIEPPDKPHFREVRMHLQIRNKGCMKYGEEKAWLLLAG